MISIVKLKMYKQVLDKYHGVGASVGTGPVRLAHAALLDHFPCESRERDSPTLSTRVSVEYMRTSKDSLRDGGMLEDDIGAETGS